MSELTYGGKSLAEIAGYTSTQLGKVIGRPRDKFGNLDRDDGVPKFVKDNIDSSGQWKIESGESFKGMYKHVKAKQGKPQDKVDADWHRFVEREAPYVLQQPQQQQAYGSVSTGSSWSRGR